MNCGILNGVLVGVLTTHFVQQVGILPFLQVIIDNAASVPGVGGGGCGRGWGITMTGS